MSERTQFSSEVDHSGSGKAGLTLKDALFLLDSPDRSVGDRACKLLYDALLQAARRFLRGSVRAGTSELHGSESAVRGCSAKDVAQMTLVKLYGNQVNLRTKREAGDLTFPNDGAVRAYLSQAVSNKVDDLHRRARREPNLLDCVHSPEGGAVPVEADALTQLGHASPESPHDEQAERERERSVRTKRFLGLQEEFIAHLEATRPPAQIEGCRRIARAHTLLLDGVGWSAIYAELEIEDVKRNAFQQQVRRWRMAFGAWLESLKTTDDPERVAAAADAVGILRALRETRLGR